MASYLHREGISFSISLQCGNQCRIPKTGRLVLYADEPLSPSLFASHLPGPGTANAQAASRRSRLRKKVMKRVQCCHV